MYKIKYDFCPIIVITFNVQNTYIDVTTIMV